MRSDQERLLKIAHDAALTFWREDRKTWSEDVDAWNPAADPSEWPEEFARIKRAFLRCCDAVVASRLGEGGAVEAPPPPRGVPDAVGVAMARAARYEQALREIDGLIDGTSLHISEIQAVVNRALEIPPACDRSLDAAARADNIFKPETTTKGA